MRSLKVLNAKRVSHECLEVTNSDGTKKVYMINWRILPQTIVEENRGTVYTRYFVHGDIQYIDIPRNLDTSRGY